MTQLFAAVVAATLVVSQTPADALAPALEDFAKRVHAYLELREELGGRLEPTASAADLRVRQEALTTALRRARSGAKPGDLIPPAVQDQIRETVKADMARRSASARRASLEEVPGGPLPGINRKYPEQAALPTVPPLLLASLPRLPDNLQYRFFGRHVVILDGDVEIVLDYVRDAVPR